MHYLRLMLFAAVLSVTVLPVFPAAAASYTDTVDLTFPVAGEARYVDSFHDGRSGGRIHKATDLMADHGVPVHAAMSGRISWMSTPASSGCGYCVFVDGDDGRKYRYIHLGPKASGQEDQAFVSGLSRGDRLERGELLGWVGCSGNASCSAPHLHFSIEDPAVRDPYGTNFVNPYDSLRAAEDRGDYPGQVNAASGRFYDVPADSTHAADINAIAEAAITKGCNPPSNTRYCPAELVTRGQMASFLARAMSLPGRDHGAFTDTRDSVHRAAINAIAEAGVTKGCNPPANDRFCPDEAVTRQEMASFIARARGLAGSDNAAFTDVAADNVHRAAINAIAQEGITKGCNPPNNDRFCPGERVTREQMASFLTRAFLQN